MNSFYAMSCNPWPVTFDTVPKLWQKYYKILVLLAFSGLYIGLSVAALFEVLFYLIHIIFHTIRIGFCGSDSPDPDPVPAPTFQGPNPVKFNGHHPPPIYYDDIGPPGSYFF